MFRRLRRGGSSDLVMLEGSKRQDAVGESFYQGALSAICGGRSREGHELDVVAELRPEPSNKHDRNAVAVIVSKRVVGYLPKEQAAKLHTRIAQLSKSAGKGVGCRAQIVGGWDRGRNDQGHFGVRLLFDPKQIP